MGRNARLLIVWKNSSKMSFPQLGWKRLSFFEPGKGDPEVGCGNSGGSAGV